MSRQYNARDGGGSGYPPGRGANGNFTLHNAARMIREINAKLDDIVNIAKSAAAKVNSTSAEQPSSVASTVAALKTVPQNDNAAQTANVAREQHVFTNNNLKYQSDATRNALRTLQPAQISRDQHQSVLNRIDTLPTVAIVDSHFEHTIDTISDEFSELRKSFSELKEAVTDGKAAQPTADSERVEQAPSPQIETARDLMRLVESRDQRIAKLLETVDSQRQQIEDKDKRIQELLEGNGSQGQQNTPLEQPSPRDTVQAHEHDAEPPNATSWKPQEGKKRRRSSSTSDREDRENIKKPRAAEGTTLRHASGSFKSGEPSVGTFAESPIDLTNSQRPTFGKHQPSRSRWSSRFRRSPGGDSPSLVVTVDGVTSHLSILPQELKHQAEGIFAAAASKGHGVTRGDEDNISTRCLSKLGVNFDIKVDRPGESCGTCIGARRLCLQITSGDEVVKCVPLPAAQRKGLSPGDRGHWILQD